MSSLLRIDQIHSYYGSAHILHGLSLQVEVGERVALIGRNGMGKTTLVNSLMGIARIGGGRVELQGREVTKFRPYVPSRFDISVVPQGRCIISNLTVEENLLLGGAARRAGHWNLRTVYELFPILRERAATPGTALSGGQQQMLAIGRSLMANPRLIILDEPTEGLAPVIVDDLARMMNRVTGEGTAVLLIEQNLGLVMNTTDRYYAIEKGAVVGAGVIRRDDSAELQRYVTA